LTVTNYIEDVGTSSDGDALRGALFAVRTEKMVASGMEAQQGRARSACRRAPAVAMAPG
jgi:hypothetical protein